jgi:hypothetical protein
LAGVGFVGWISEAQSDIRISTMRSIAKQRTAAQAPVMNDCRITPSAYPTYETVSLRSPQ